MGIVLLVSCTGSVNLVGLEPSDVQDSVSRRLPAGLGVVKGLGAFGTEPQGSLGSPATGSALRLWHERDVFLPPPLSLHSLFAAEMLQMLCALGHGQWDGLGWAGMGCNGMQWRSPPWWGLCSALFAGCAHNRSPAGAAQQFPPCSV